MTENFPKSIKNDKKSGYMDTQDQIEKYSQNSAIAPKYIELKGLGHFNQSDMIIVSPIEQYLISKQSLPHPDYVDFYLMNVWLAMKFLEDEGLCSNPKSQIGIYKRLNSLKQHILTK